MTDHVTLDIGGMTCASCAVRVEKRLGRLPGVTATVNYATAKAAVDLPDGVVVADAIAAVERAGYLAAIPEPHHEPDDGPATRLLLLRLIVSASLAVPVLLFSMVPPLQFPGWQWLALALAAPVATWGAWPFHRAAAITAAHGGATMDTLVSVGVAAAYGWSLWALVFGGAGEAGMRMTFEWSGQSQGGTALYLEVASAVTVFLLAGRYFEARARTRSSAALDAVLRLGAKTADVVRDGAENTVPIGELRVGDVFVVRPGAQVSTDGVVIEGMSAVDTGLLTGEPVPVDVGPGDVVVGSAMNSGGRLLVRATRIGADTEVARIGRLVAQAQTGKAEVQRLADRVAAVFVPVVILLALVTLGAWLLVSGDAEAAFTAAVATVIIACPCALGLATPTALLVGTGRGAQLGILIRGPQVLESTRRIDTVVLDKTGTVTTGLMTVTRVLPEPGGDPALLLAVAGAAERGSEHPIGRAIAAAASGDGSVGARTDGFESTAGLGVRAVVDGRHVVVGRPDWLRSRGVHLGEHAMRHVTEQSRTGTTVIAVGWDGAFRGSILLADEPRPSSAAAVAEFKRLGLRTVLLTGDARAVAESVGRTVGADEVVAEVLPATKVDAVRRLQAAGRVVAMIGDGVNDAAALAQADLGIAMGSGSDVAIEASDITLVRTDLLTAVDAVLLARRTLGIIKGNLFWAFAYNAAAIPLAMAGLLNPVIAGAAMAFSSVFVVSNSLRLRGFQPTPLRRTSA